MIFIFPCSVAVILNFGGFFVGFADKECMEIMEIEIPIPNPIESIPIPQIHLEIGNQIQKLNQASHCQLADSDWPACLLPAS